MTLSMNKDIGTMLITEEDLNARISELGVELSNDFEDEDIVFVAVLKGAFVFLADLMRSITVPLEVDFMSISTYGSDVKSSGEIKIRADITKDIQGKNIVIVEDILDTGFTLKYLIQHLKDKGAKLVKTCVLLDKKEAHKIEINPDYTGFEIPSEFVVGYGLDYDEKYRNLPYVGVLKKEIYS